VTYLTPAEVAERLRVSVATVRRHRREWGAIRIGGRWRFDPETLKQRLEGTAKRQPVATSRIRIPAVTI
jgi:excisionase family DNA binding protein